MGVTRDKNHLLRPVGHVLVPAATIAGLSMLLAGGLELLGFLDHMNAGIARLAAPGDAVNFPRHLPEWGVWLAAGLFALGLAITILGSPGHGRRAILWISTVVVVVAWAPVLSLAAYAPEIAAPGIAALWSGVCAMVYVANHRMPCDLTKAPPDDAR